jgi:hypothetical protein
VALHNWRGAEGCRRRPLAERLPFLRTCGIPDSPRRRGLEPDATAGRRRLAGLSSADAAGLEAIAGLVARLDALADRGGARLQRHGAPTTAQRTAMQLVDPDDLPFDPETTAADEAAGTLDPSDEHTARRRLPILATAGVVGAAVLAGLLARYIGRARR